MNIQKVSSLFEHIQALKEENIAQDLASKKQAERLTYQSLQINQSKLCRQTITASSRIICCPPDKSQISLCSSI